MSETAKRNYTTITLPNELINEIKRRYGPWTNLSAFVKFIVEEKLKELKESQN